MIVADTGVLVDNLRGLAAAADALERGRSAGERLVSSTLTKLEIFAGVRPGEEGPTQALLDELEWIDVDDAVAERAGALAARFLRTHPGVEIVDYVVAATRGAPRSGALDAQPEALSDVPRASRAVRSLIEPSPARSGAGCRRVDDHTPCSP